MQANIAKLCIPFFFPEFGSYFLFDGYINLHNFLSIEASKTKPPQQYKLSMCFTKGEGDSSFSR